MVVQAPLRTGFRVTPGPDTRVNGKPCGLRCEWVRSYQALEARQVHGSRVEGIVEAAPAAVAGGRQAEVRRRFEGRHTQHGVECFKEPVAATPKERIHLMAEGSESFPVWCVHIHNDGLSSFFLSTALSPIPYCWLKCKLSRHKRFRKYPVLRSLGESRCWKTIGAAVY
jgi:hypothetical protein